MFSPVTMRALFVALVIAGVFGITLRFVSFSNRLLWTDEAITALRIAGHTDREMIERFADGRPHTVAQINAYIEERSPGLTSAVLQSLALEDAQHPPLYYLLASWWTKLLHPSIAALRMLSVLIGSLIPFAVAWLCYELYGDAMAAALGFAFAGLSPVLIIFSQQAREYGLWALLVALSTALLLRAVRSASIWWWTAYAVSLLAGIYTNPLFITTLAAHTIYALIALRGRVRAYGLCCVAVALIGFVPWAIQIWEHRRAIELSNAWTATPWPFSMLLQKWLFNAGTTFFDREFSDAYAAVTLLPVAAITAAALWWSLRQCAKPQKIMVILLVAAPLALFVPDLILHQHRSSVTRYGMALWIALIVAVAGFLAAQLKTPRRSWSLAGALYLLAAASISSALDVRSTVWWDNHEDGENLAIARIVNASAKPLIVSDANWARVLALSFYLRPSVEIQSLSSRGVRRVAGFDATYLLATTRGGAAIRRTGVPLRVVYHSSEDNPQLRRFRGTDTGADYLSLWLLTGG